MVKLTVPRTERFKWPLRYCVTGEMPRMSMKPVRRIHVMSERQKTISKVPTASDDNFTKALMVAKKKAATSIQQDCSIGFRGLKEKR